MRIRKKLYVSEALEGKEKKMIRRIRKGRFPLNLYVLAVPEDDGEQLEFYDSMMLSQSCYRKQDSLIVGLAFGYDEAVDIVLQITKEALENTGDVNLRKYLLETGRK
jgi:hypothetical protein